MSSVKSFFNSNKNSQQKEKKDIKNGKRKTCNVHNINASLVNKETNKACVFVDIPLTLFGVCVSHHFKSKRKHCQQTVY